MLFTYFCLAGLLGFCAREDERSIGVLQDFADVLVQLRSAVTMKWGEVCNGMNVVFSGMEGEVE